MIRFPNRFHASTTPGASRMRAALEPNYQERDPPMEGSKLPKGQGTQPEFRPRDAFDFSTIMAVLG